MINRILHSWSPGCVAQSVGHLLRKSEVLGSIPSLATYVLSPSADSRRAVFSYWRKYVHEVLVNRLGSISLPRKSVVRLTDRPGMTLDVYRGRKPTSQQQQQHSWSFHMKFTTFAEGSSNKCYMKRPFRVRSHRTTGAFDDR